MNSLSLNTTTWSAMSYFSLLLYLLSVVCHHNSNSALLWDYRSPGTIVRGSPLRPYELWKWRGNLRRYKVHPIYELRYIMLYVGPVWLYLNFPAVYEYSNFLRRRDGIAITWRRRTSVPIAYGVCWQRQLYRCCNNSVRSVTYCLKAFAAEADVTT